MVACFVKRSLRVLDDIATVTEESRRASEHLDRGGSSTVFGRLGRLGEAIPDGARDRDGGLIFRSHLNHSPRGSAKAGGASLEAGSAIENVTLKGPEVAVADLAAILNIFDASSVSWRFNVCSKVRAKPADESRASRATGESLIYKVLGGDTCSGFLHILAVILPYTMEERVELFLVELAKRVHIVAFFDEPVFRPDRVADDRAQRSFLYGR